MRRRKAYFNTDFETQANICDESVPLAVNSTGVEYFNKPFESSKSFRNDYGIVYVMEGSIYFNMTNETITLGKGDFIVLKPKTKTSYGTKDSFLNYYWLQFTGYNIKNLFDKLNLEFNTPYKIGVYEDLKGCFKRIAREFTVNDSFFSDTSVAVLTETLVMFSRYLERKDKYFLRSLDYIEEHFSENIPIEKLASIEGLSVSHYRAVFKKRLNITPNEYITMKRINSACFYLQHTSYSIEKTARLVGYEDSFYFSRVFKKKTGISPMRYRRENQ